MLLGLLVGGWLLPGPRAVGSVVFDLQTLLYAALALLIGFQSASFATCAKVFAISEGLLPEDPRLTKVFQYITLEVGLIIGLVLMALGLAGSIGALGMWSQKAFGDLNPAHTLRLTIPSVVAICLGYQVMLSSFFLSVLRMKRR